LGRIKVEGVGQRGDAKVIEYLQGRYAAQEKPFGVVYRWSLERVVECKCGARPTLTAL
jgi:hypothetical protein